MEQNNSNETVFKRFFGTGDQPFTVPLEEAIAILRDNCLSKGSLHSPSAVYSFNRKEVEL